MTVSVYLGRPSAVLRTTEPQSASYCSRRLCVHRCACPRQHLWRNRTGWVCRATDSATAIEPPGASRSVGTFTARSRPIERLTNEQEVDAALADLQRQAAAWIDVSGKDKAALLRDVQSRAIKAAKVMGEAAAKTAGLTPQEDPLTPLPAAAAPLGLLVTPTVAKVLSEYIKVLESGQREEENVTVVRVTSDGRSVIDCGLCKDANDFFLAGSHTWLYAYGRGGVTTGREAAEDAARAGVGVVLGGGNQAFLAMEDALHVLLDKGLPVILKHHPAQFEAGSIWEYVMEPLAQAGVYKGVVADVPMTQAAVYSPRTQGVHMTGSLQTYEAILWGTGEPGARRKENGTPLLQGPFTAELGGVAPVFITPGRWSRADMLAAAQAIWFAASNNAGCNCVTPRAIIMSAEWPQAEEFEEVVAGVFRNSPPVPCWYPGAKQRYQKFLNDHSGYELVPAKADTGVTFSEEVLPFAVQRLTLASQSDAANVTGLQEEYFAPVLLMVRIPTPAAVRAAATVPRTEASNMIPLDTPESDSDGTAGDSMGTEDDSKVLDRSAKFLEQIPDFAEKYLHGNLTCALYVPSSIQRAMTGNVHQCIDDLKYGTIVVNGASIVSYSNLRGVWGAHVGPHTSPKNVGSGIGKIHNFSKIDGLEKAVTAFPWGSTIDMSKVPEIPGFLVLPLAGAMSCGLRGLWAALTP